MNWIELNLGGPRLSSMSLDVMALLVVMGAISILMMIGKHDDGSDDDE